MLSTNSVSFTSSYQTWIPFICFSYLIAMSWVFNTMLNKNGESEHPCLIPDLRENAFSFSPLYVMLAVVLLYIIFFMLRYVPFIHTLLRAFMINRCWILSKAFTTTIEKNLMIIIKFINMMYHFDWFLDIEPSLLPWNKSHLIIAFVFFQFANVL